MIIVGVYARVETGKAEEIRARLDGIEGMETFALTGPDTLGILLEAPDLDRAHSRLMSEIRGAEGVLAAWPVYMQDGDERENGAGSPWGIPATPE